MPAQRPKYLNLVKIKLPLPGVVSILHRISGALLFLFLPFVLYLLQASLASPQSYAQAGNLLSHPLCKLLLIGLAWAFWHHFCAGLRYLALDLHYGAGIAQARLSGKLVLVAGLVLTLVTASRIW